MRAKVSEKLENGRMRDGEYASEPGKLYGMFKLRGPTRDLLLIMSSGSDADSSGWEHVSVSLKHRTPTWEEMCFVKDLFWDDEEMVLQIHPAKSKYVNFHPYCLHLWRSLAFDMPTPDPLMVGPKT
jgi:hypothetical protein